MDAPTCFGAGAFCFGAGAFCGGAGAFCGGASVCVLAAGGLFLIAPKPKVANACVRVHWTKNRVSIQKRRVFVVKTALSRI